MPDPAAVPLEGYRPLRLLRRGRRHRVTLAQAPDGSPVVLKQPRAELASGAARFRLQREHDYMLAIESRHVLRPIACLADGAEPTLVLPWHDGVPLAELAAPLPAADLPEIAHQAALALRDTHAGNVLHLDINPSNIVWNAAQRRLAVVDFSSAIRLHGSAAPEGRLGHEGTLPFMSPEQAGLLNRPLDNRSDLYSLGVTMYRLATGALPFEARDALGWAHAHLTATPVPLSQRRPDLPSMLGTIVHRLLAKTPEARYQTAWGLAHDLERVAANGADFTPGERDVSDRLNTAPALHGRDAELAALRDAWDGARQGSSAAVWIGGEAGSGKTRLVGELRRSVASAGALVLYGKFDASQQGVPYAALGDSLAGWVEQRLADPADARAQWRERLMETIGAESAAALGTLLPRLWLLLQMPAPPPGDAPTRPLQQPLRELLKLIAGPTRPLLLGH